MAEVSQEAGETPFTVVKVGVLVTAKVMVEGEVEVVRTKFEPGEKRKEVSVRPAKVEVTKGRVFATVTVPVALLTLIPVPAWSWVTPMLVTVTAPVELSRLMPVPAVVEET